MGFFAKRKYKKAVQRQTVTSKGDCLYQYCKKIADREWAQKDYIEAYDQDLEEMRNHFIEKGYSCSKEEVARAIVEIMNDIKEANK